MEEENQDEFINSDDEGVEIVADLDGSERNFDGEDDEDEDGDFVADGDDDDMDFGDRIQPSRDDATLYFEGHSSAIFAVQISPSGRFLVSGGKDDKACLWSREGEEISQVTGFSDSVTNVGFSADEKYFLAGDMSGKTKVIQMSNKEVVLDVEMDEVSWTCWHAQANIIVAGLKDGSIYLWMIPSQMNKILTSFGQETTCGKFHPDGKQLVAGYADGTIRFWDVKSSQCIKTINNVHSDEIITIDISAGGLIASGGHDDFRISNASTGKLLDTIDDFEDSVESAVFSPDGAWLAVGGLDGRLLIWDVAASLVRHWTKLGTAAGICKIIWVGKNHIVVSCLDAVLREFDVRSANLVKSWEGHTSNILDLTWNGTTLAAASEDHRVGIFEGVVVE